MPAWAKQSERRYKVIFLILSKITLPCSTARTMVEKLLSKSTRSALSLAASVPLPSATPISAFIKAGASLTPSPVIATTSPLAFRALTMRNLSIGRVRAKTAAELTRLRNSSSDISGNSLPWIISLSETLSPTSPAMALAVKRWSPVIIITLMPAAWHNCIASLTWLRTGSRKAKNPINVKLCIKFVSRPSNWFSSFERSLIAMAVMRSPLWISDSNSFSNFLFSALLNG